MGPLPEALFPRGHMKKAGDLLPGVVLWEGLLKPKMTKTGTDLNGPARLSLLNSRMAHFQEKNDNWLQEGSDFYRV